MKKLLILLLGVIAVSCSDDATIIENNEIIEEQNKIELKINGETSTDSIVQIKSYFICDQELNVTVTSKKENITSDLIRFNLTKEGELKYVYFADKSGNFTKDYYSPDFVPSSTITIINFEFSENAMLKFKFSGEVFKLKHNHLEPNETIQIDGSVEIETFLPNSCDVFVNYINLNNNIKFSNISRRVDPNQQIGSIRYEGNSLNGFNINIKNLNQYLPDMPIGTYQFSNNSVTEKIEFRKYIGVPKSYSTSFLIPTDWLLYETEGSFTIVEKTTVNGFQVVKLKLNFTASLNGTVEYSFSDAEFVTAY